MAAVSAAWAHEGGHSHGVEAGGFSEAMRDEITARYRVSDKPAVVSRSPMLLSQMLTLGSLAAVQDGGGGPVTLYSPPAGNGSLMIASFAPFRPMVRFYNDAAYFYVEGDSRSGNDVIIQWPTQAGISYSVQTSEDLINWANIPVGTANTWTDTSALGAAPKRFYRVMR